MVGRNLSFKFAIGLMALGFIEALIKAVWPAFPLTEAYAFELGIATAWFTKRAYTDTRSMQYGNGKTAPPD
jgi:hypothetical protein